MEPEDSRRFTEILTAMGTLYGSSVSAEQIKLWFKILENAEIEVFEEVAMDYMKSDSAFMPKPGQILKLINELDGRPSPEQAWNMLRFSEDDTNVWTEEMKKAFWPALSSVECGDRIGARMAFLETYRREVSKARNTNKPVCWGISLGYDASRHIEAVHNAVEMGYIESDRANEFLPHLSRDEINSGEMVLLDKTEFTKLIGRG